MPQPQKPIGDLPRWKKLLFYSVLMIIVAAVLESFGALYLKVSRGYDGEHLLWHEFDPYKNVLPTRNYIDTRGIRHNSVGFRRDGEVPIKKPEGIYRVFLMGGSTAYGLGGLWKHIQRDFEILDNTETIDAYLEHTLRAALPDRNVEVINAAISSHWTHHHLIYLNQSILRYDPDMVIFLDGFNDYFTFYKSHDQFASYAYTQHSRLIMGEPTLESLLYANGWWLFRKSAFAHVVGRTGRKLKQMFAPSPSRSPLDVENALASFRDNFAENALQMNKRIAALLNLESVRAVFVLQPMLILERDRPHMGEMERTLFEFNVSSYLEGTEQYMHEALRFVRQKMPETVEPLGATFVDATAIYRDATEQIFTDYCHLTPRGNEILSNAIAHEIIPLAQGPAPGSASEGQSR